MGRSAVGREVVSAGAVVLHLFKRLDAGGAEMRTLEMIELLGAAAGTRTVVGVLGSRGGSLEDRFSDAGVEIVDLRLNARFPLELRRLVRAKRVQILHVHSSTASGFFLLLGWLFSVDRRIAHFRSDSDGVTGTARRRVQRAIGRLLIRACATDVVAVSPAAMAFAGRWTRRSRRCRVVPSGLRAPALVDDSARTALRARLGVGPGDIMITHVGRDHPVKNRPRALHVLARCAPHDGRAQLVILGRLAEGEAASLGSLATELGVLQQVTIVGQVDDVASYLGSSNVTLVTSTREGLPGVVLESVALGTPVVSSDVPGSVWISETFDSVRCLSLESPDEIWAAAVLDAAGEVDQLARQKALELFERSAFSAEVAREQFARLWSARPRP